ncbi:MAG: hypothetical protein ACREFE_13635 [Limisphaerales bacterium]
MKAMGTILTALLISISVIARITAPFPGWDRLEKKSPDIIIANCGKPTLSTPGVLVANAPASDSSIEILAVLKGTNNIHFARLLTDHDLREGENYLIFGYYDDGMYQAYDEYKVIPLGAKFSTNWISGKTLDAQIQILFQRAVDNLNLEIQKHQEEKQRLETGIGRY